MILSTKAIIFQSSIFLAVLMIQPVKAEVVTDGTAGAIVTMQGNQYTIDQQLGTMVGDNLFHSFLSFNVKTNETATFTGNSAIKNVISRVTGGNSSNIDGTISSQIGSEGFYLINPAGIVFGNNAQVDVPASFYATTAKQLIFSNGDIVNSDSPTASSFSIATPQSFGFAANSNSKITIDAVDLSVKNGNQLSFVANNLDVNLNASQNTRLTAAEGGINLIAQGSSTQVIPVKNTDLSTGANGDIFIKSTTFDVRGNGSGSVYLQGANLELSDSTITADNNGSQDAVGKINIQAQNLTMDQSNIDADVLSSGNGANLVIDVSDKMLLNNISNISMNSEVGTLGDVGQINIKAQDFVMLDRSFLTTSANGDGKGGDINISSSSILLDGYDYRGIGAGVGIRSSSLSSASVARVDGEPQVVTNQALGNSGNINIKTNSIDIIQTARISTSTFSKGNAGKVQIDAQQINLDSKSYAGDINKQGEPYITGIFSNTSVFEKSNIVLGFDATTNSISREDVRLSASGNAGEIILNADNIYIKQTAQVSSSTTSLGNAGTIQVNSQLLDIDSLGLVAASTGLLTESSNASSGDAGSISVNSKQLTISNAAVIKSSSATSGQAGSISINASAISMYNNGLISVKGKDKTDNNAINTPTININARSLQLSQQSNISAQSDGTASGGKITVSASNDIILDSLSQISTEANDADAGSITLDTPALLLNNGLVTSSVGRLVDGQPVIHGNAGDISLNSNSLIMSAGFIQANTQGVSGHGGAIFVNSNQVVSAYNRLAVGGGVPQDFLANSGENIIQAASPAGSPGKITITSPIDNMTTLLQAVDSSFKPIVVIANNPCEMESGELPSSLIISGRGALPRKPADDVLISPISLSQASNENSIRSRELVVKQVSRNQLTASNNNLDTCFFKPI